ncbi:hypothetical protein [Zhongshania sp. BJYM1]|uniref:hypothetical protein n=1 Tax=Zhongshania aquatica TaxID=2965069 RepID=UPI0022B56E21|nr:hypothetical protein [Marortus sp. BJYM1]
MRAIIKISLLILSVNSFAGVYDFDCNGKPISSITPAISGAELEDRIDRTCGQMVEFGSSSESDTSMRDREILRIMKRFYPGDKMEQCAADKAEKISARIGAAISLSETERFLQNLRGSSSGKTTVSAKGLCRDALLDDYDKYL